MTDEEFKDLAARTARNAQGLRSLAAHVRQLYVAIRTLQRDDNGFAYMAEIIQAARGDKRDAMEFVDRVKTYHHRDRSRMGDPVIERGMVRCAPYIAPEMERVANADAGNHDSPSHTMEGQGLPQKDQVPPPIGPQSLVGANEKSALPISDFQMRHETSGKMPLYARPGQRRVVPGG